MRRFSLIILAVFLLPLTSGAAIIPTFDPSSKYANGEIVEILIVPGHDDKHSGAVFRGMREADMNLMLGKKIAAELRRDPQIFVTLSRDDAGYYPPLAEYLEKNEEEIAEFIEDSKEDTAQFLARKKIIVDSGVTHNNAPADVALGLYGINKWASEESFDFVIHVHFNDDTSHVGDNMGEYGGYTVYIPEKNLPNAEKAVPFAESVGKELGKTFFPSNLPIESSRSDEFGLVPDFKLIALGSNMTLKTPSILVEYSYIYEPHVREEFLDLSTSVMTRATTRGFFNHLSGTQKWHNLSYTWKQSMSLSVKKSVDVLALQYGLRELGFYPPKSHDREDCPFSGLFGPCTQKAVKAFQRANGLSDDGIAGPATLGKLNAVFGF